MTTTSKPKFNELNGKQWLKHSISVWSDITRTAEDKTDHPAAFPIDLASRIIEIFTRPGELVIDPMCGSGTTLLAAQRLGRPSFGIDLSPDYVNIAWERLSGGEVGPWAQVVRDDARNIAHLLYPRKAKLCLTSPPYWDVLSRRRSVTGGDPTPYSDDEQDFSNIPDYDDFLKAMGEVFGEVMKALEPGGFCVIVCMDVRRGPEFYPLHIDLTRVMQEQGFILDDIIVWDKRKDYYGFRPLGYPYRFRVNKAHEFLMIYQKEPL